jgi:hypothetical protein
VLVGSGNCEQSKVHYCFKLPNTREDHKTNSRLIIVEVYVVSSFYICLRDISNENRIRAARVLRTSSKTPKPLTLFARRGNIRDEQLFARHLG